MKFVHSSVTISYATKQVAATAHRKKMKASAPCTTCIALDPILSFMASKGGRMTARRGALKDPNNATTSWSFGILMAITHVRRTWGVAQEDRTGGQFRRTAGGPFRRTFDHQYKNVRVTKIVVHRAWWAGAVLVTQRR